MITIDDFERLRDIPAAHAILCHASTLSLHDAAYELWRMRHQFRVHERVAGIVLLSQIACVDGPDMQLRPRVDSGSIDAIKDERANAHMGATFFLTEIAHPQADRDEIREAIKTAVALEDEFQHLSHEVASATKGVFIGNEEKTRMVIALLRREFPTYSVVTFDSLIQENLVANRLRSVPDVRTR